MKEWIDRWKIELGIEDWSISTSPIDPENHSVDYHDQHYFVGISSRDDVKKATIYHDIPLDEESVIHELLHVKFPEEDFPDKSFEQYEHIIDTTAKLLLQKKTLMDPTIQEMLRLKDDGLPESESPSTESL